MHLSRTQLYQQQTESRFVQSDEKLSTRFDQSMSRQPESLHQSSQSNSIQNSTADQPQEPSHRSSDWNIEEISNDINQTKHWMCPSSCNGDGRKSMAAQHSNKSEQRRRCMNRESFKTVLLCPTHTLTPSRKAIKHRTKSTQIFYFKPCAESSDVEQDNAEQQRCKRQY